LSQSFPLSFVMVDIDNNLRECYTDRNHLERDWSSP